MSITWFRPTALPIDPFGTPDRGYSSMRVTSPFGVRDDPLNPGANVFHGGLDIGNARLGDKIVAAAAGRVVDVGNLKEPWSQSTRLYPSGNYGGLMVVLAHEGSHISLYAHMGEIASGFAKGDRIPAGTILGKVGETGAAQGRGHLHFGVSNHSAQEIINAGRLLPNAWCIDPWPLLDATSEWENPAVIAELRADLAKCRARGAALVAKRNELLAEIAAQEQLIEELATAAAQIPALRDKVRRLRLVNKRLRDQLEAIEEEPPA